MTTVLTFFFFNIFIFLIFLLYNTVLVVPNIDMNLPQVYMSSQPCIILEQIHTLTISTFHLAYSLEGMILKLKLWYFGHLMRRVDSLEKTLMLGGIGGQEEKGTTEDEMAGWHH